METSESAEETSEDEEEEEDAGDSASGGATFGEKHEISDRMAVTVSEPEEFTPGEYAFVEGDWDVFVSMDVTLENIGDEPVESMELMTRATSGSQEAEPIFDTDSGLDMPTAVVQPGRELEFTMGYGVNSGEPFDLTVEDMMDFESTGVTLSTTID
ncbi:hypothetical protein [uncultured Ornithinimicrobium sp.]|uniref:hypothetical protein n=1 Tax=uncultured Ornithinimicrobium sp. TaxID=259307 RepID=UPI00259A06AC|nr:hypothetical protein [uncultured Ornithinimicrobium sp.]